MAWRDFHRLKRDLALAVDESLYASIEDRRIPSCCSTWRSRSACKRILKEPRE
jgi:hypothetical protein